MSRRRSSGWSEATSSRSPTAACPTTLAGSIPDRQSLLLQSPESLGKSLALDVRIGQEVLHIDPKAKGVEVRDLATGRTYRESYDKLMLCPGAEAIRPPIPGAVQF